MPMTLAQLRTPMTRAECLTTILTQLSALGFNTSAWQSGSVQRTFLTGVAEVYSRITLLVDSLSRLGFNADASGDALTAFSLSHYANTRGAATSTSGLCTLTAAAGIGPFVIAIGQLVGVESANGYTYRNTTGGVLPLGGTLTLTFESETAGQATAVANNTITALQTPIAGVSINNPDPGTGTWITTAGTDAEADATLRTRNTSRWATLSYASPSDAYVQFALAADADVTRVEVDDANPRGAGTVDVYCARSTATATAGDVTNVQTYIDLKRPCTSDVLAQAAATQAQAFTATVYLESALNTSAKQAEVTAALTAYVSGLPIGGLHIPPGVTGYMPMSELIGAITSIDGVSGVVFTVPAASVVVPAHTILTMGAVSLTFVSV